MSRAAPVPRARDLAYSLYRRPLHPELLPTARTATAEKPRWRARLSLLEGAGHAIAFSTPAGQVLLELLAPQGLDVPSGGRVELRDLGSALRDRVKLRGELLYASAYAVEASGADEFGKRHQKILGSRSPGERLLLDRSHPENDGPKPFSLLDWETKDSALEVMAVHAFPRERTFVFVQSSFAPEPPRP